MHLINLSAPLAEPPEAETRQSRSWDRSGNLAKEIQQIVKEKYMENITLESIAQDLNFSFFYLSKIFKQNTGISFTEYLTDYRIRKAGEMLQSSDLSIKEIAYATGFRSQGYFSKVFRKYTGLMPTEFRTKSN